MFTNKKIVLHGYHGWHEWCGRTSMNAGIPKEMFQNTKTFKYNDINSFERYLKIIRKNSAVILEPMNIELRHRISKKKDNVLKNNTILIFDEICTDLDFHYGAQNYLV